MRRACRYWSRKRGLLRAFNALPSLLVPSSMHFTSAQVVHVHVRTYAQIYARTYICWYTSMHTLIHAGILGTRIFWCMHERACASLTLGLISVRTRTHSHTFTLPSRCMARRFGTKPEKWVFVWLVPACFELLYPVLVPPPLADSIYLCACVKQTVLRYLRVFGVIGLGHRLGCKAMLFLRSVHHVATYVEKGESPMACIIIRVIYLFVIPLVLSSLFKVKQNSFLNFGLGFSYFLIGIFRLYQSLTTVRQYF